METNCVKNNVGALPALYARETVILSLHIWHQYFLGDGIQNICITLMPYYVL